MPSGHFQEYFVMNDLRIQTLKNMRIQTLKNVEKPLLSIPNKKIPIKHKIK